MTTLENKRILRLRALTALGALGLAICCCASTNCASAYGQTDQNGRGTRQVVYFTTRIENASAPVYASPNLKSYRAGTVLKDREVEIYFRNDDGFCAVRPPYGSFSWINGKFVVQDDDGDGRVRITSGKTAPVRVGGESPSTSSVVQVGLRNNQKVKILGKVTLSDGSLWYKISPPSGEFRWIHESSLPKNASLANVPNKLTFQDEYERRNASVPTADYRGSSEPSPTRAESIPSPASQNHSNGEYLPLPPGFAPKEETSPSLQEENAERGLELPPYQIGVDLNGLKNVDESLRRELAEINAETLKLAVAQEPARDEIKALRRRAESVALTAKSADEQKLANSILDALRTAEENAIQRENLRAEKYPMIESVAEPTQISPVYPGVANAFANQWIAPNPTYLPPLQQSYPQVAPGFAIQTPPAPAATNVAPRPANPSRVVVADSPQKIAESKNKSRLEFAFSNANSPFRKQSGASDAGTPVLELPAAKLIVPPQSYGQGAFLAQRKNTTNASPAWLAQKSATRAAPSTSLAQTQPAQGEALAQGSAVFQAPFASPARSTATSPAQSPAPTTELVASAEPIAESEVTVWQSAADARVAPVSPSAASKIANATTNLPSAIRQASAFAPVASNSAAHFDAEGLLVELSDAPKGAPKFALLEQNANGYAIVAYLETKKDAAFAPFIGKKVAVKGAVGSVAVDGETNKLISVTSLFLQK